MRAIRDSRIIRAWEILAIALLVLILAPVDGMAVTGSDICVYPIPASYGGPAGDYDNDGLTNSEECNGINLVGSGSPYVGYLNRGNSGRSLFLDPSGKDLFFFLDRAANTLIPASEPAGIYSAGLGVATHEINAADANGDRFVTSTQKAIRITESLNTTGTIFGAAWHGNPNALDQATVVYTQRIANFVNTKCSAATTCKDVSGVSGIANVTNLYIRNVIAHEAGHSSNLTSAYSNRYEYHYAAGSGTVMEQSAKYTSSKGVVTFYLSQQYTPADVAGTTLR